jgi:hypothetical protein
LRLAADGRIRSAMDMVIDVNYSCRWATTISAGGHQVHRSLG